MGTERKVNWKMACTRNTAKLIGLSCIVLLCLVLGAFIGLSAQESDVAELAAKNKELGARNEELVQAMKSIGELGQEQLDAHHQATASALLMTDGYLSGGMDKAREMYDLALQSSEIAKAKYRAIGEILARYRAVPSIGEESL